MDWQVLPLLSLRVCILSSPRGGGTPWQILGIHRQGSAASEVECALPRVESMSRCVGPFAAWDVKLQKWRAGCECHRSDLEQRKHDDCWQKGRFLHWPTITR